MQKGVFIIPYWDVKNTFWGLSNNHSKFKSDKCFISVFIIPSLVFYEYKK